MKREILPIGTICELDNNKTIMITGYKNISIENDNVAIKDYVGIKYPEGTLSNEEFKFNNENIKSILYMGYVDEKFEVIKALLNDEVEYEEKKMESTYIFDENGVLTSEVKKPVKNPFSIEEPKAEKLDEKPDDWPIFKNIEFDENGVVVSAEENTPSNIPDQSDVLGPKYQFDENGVIIGVEDEETQNEKMTLVNESEPVYEFDANGVVVGLKEKEPTQEEQTEASEPEYEFDENGVVVGLKEKEPAKEEQTEASEPEYEFDENGVVVELKEKEPAKEEQTEASEPEYEFDENGVVVGLKEKEPAKEEQTETNETKYEFDENGMVIGVE